MKDELEYGKYEEALLPYMQYVYSLARTCGEAAVNAATAAVLENTQQDSGQAAANWYLESKGLKGPGRLKAKDFQLNRGRNPVGQKGEKRGAGHTAVVASKMNELRAAVKAAIWDRNETVFILGNEIPDVKDSNRGGNDQTYQANARIDLAVSKGQVAASRAWSRRKASYIADNGSVNWIDL